MQLSSDNDVRSLRLIASVDKRAIFNDTAVESLGCIRLQGLAVHGQVQILARDKVRSGHVDVDGLDVIAADARAQSDRPSGFGVKVIQGAFTLWNMHADESIVISADLKGLSAGRPSAPVIGSGILVSGSGFKGGRLVVRLLETGAVYSDGRIAPGTPDVITGGVFTVYGAVVACATPSKCHRSTVAQLALIAAARRKLPIEVIEWPGGEPDPKGVDVELQLSEFEKVRHGGKSVLLNEAMSLAEAGAVPYYTLAAVRPEGEDAPSWRLVTGPAMYKKSGWYLPVYGHFDNEPPEAIRAEIQRAREADGYGAQVTAAGSDLTTAAISGDRPDPSVGQRFRR